MGSVARDYLAISVSKVDVEKAFSTRYILDICRKLIKPYTIRTIIILKHKINNRR